ncbi:MAG: hypothetical protein QM730_26055 [Anaerolineales bacterium]
MKTSIKLFSLFLLIATLVTACGGNATQSANKTEALGNGKVVEYTLKTAMKGANMVFIGVGGGIDGVDNPTLSANTGDTVKVKSYQW